MSLGSLGMARSAQATALLLLLLLLPVLLHVTRGQQGVEVIRHEKIEVKEGQDVALPCILRNTTSQFYVANMEWKKGRVNATKLLVYNPQFETVYYWSNITLQVDNKSMDSYLTLRGVNSWDGGIYVCVLSTYPWGNIVRETELKIRDPHVEVSCDTESPLEVEAGGNVTIRCEATPGSRYVWTKGNSLVSENSSLELWRVTEAHAGLYNLTVHTGDQEDSKRQHRVFLISVLQATTSQAGTFTDPGSVAVPSTSTSEVTAAATHLTTLTPANDLFTANVTQNMTTAANVTDDSSQTTIKNMTSLPNYTQPSATSSPPANTEQHLTHNSSSWQINQTLTLGTSSFAENTPSSDPSTGYTTVPFNSTQEASSQSESEVITSTSLKRSTQEDFTSDSVVFETTPPGGRQNHLLMLLMIVPLLILIVMGGFLCRRQIIKQRMDLPPPFKPPPPPVKYTAARRGDVLTEYAA